MINHETLFNQKSVNSDLDPNAVIPTEVSFLFDFPIFNLNF